MTLDTLAVLGASLAGWTVLGFAISLAFRHVWPEESYPELEDETEREAIARYLRAGGR